VYFTHVHAPSRVVHGAGARKALAGELSLLEAKRALVVTSPSIDSGPVGTLVNEALSSACIGTYAQARPHIPLDAVEQLRNVILTMRPDVLVAVGGGSSMDTAKAAALAASTDRSLAQLHGGVHPPTDGCVGHAPLPRIITVPTTLTGAERGGAFSIVHSHQKLYFGEVHTRPSLVIQDPDLLAFTPRRVLVASGMNSIAHSVEAFLSGTMSPFARPIHREALRLHARALPRAAESWNDREAHDSLLVAAFFASGMPGHSSGSRSGMIHAMTHAITGASGAPHGEVYGIVIPLGMRFNGAATPGSMEEISEALSGVGRTGEAAIDAFVELRSRLGLPKQLRELGIVEADLPRMAELTLVHMAAPQNVRPLGGVQNVLDLLREIY
jgi:alcohol dehydrogenase class IV